MIATAQVLLFGYALLAGCAVVVGLLFTHLLPGAVDWDDRATGWVAEHRVPWLDGVSHWGSFIADTMGVVVVATVVTVVLLARRWGRIAALVPYGLALELAVFLTANYLVRRPRPAVPHLGSTPSTFSFPSGHVAATLVLYGSIALLVAVASRHFVARCLAWTAAFVLPAWVGFSRVYQGQHHPIDVLVGLLLGMAVLVVSVMAVRVSVRSSARIRAAAR